MTKEDEEQETPTIESNEIKEVETPTPTEENNEQSADEENDNDNDDDDDESDNEPKGPLTTTQSTCILADMVSKLTLIHETSSRPLPFVDEHIAQQFLTCNRTGTTTSAETEDVKTLEHCFQRYFKSELLSGDNSFDCYYCRTLEHGQSKEN